MVTLEGRVLALLLIYSSWQAVSPQLQLKEYTKLSNVSINIQQASKNVNKL